MLESPSARYQEFIGEGPRPRRVTWIGENFVALACIVLVLSDFLRISLGRNDLRPLWTSLDRGSRSGWGQRFFVEAIVIMDMPSPRLAAQSIDCSPFGRLVRFDVYDIWSNQPSSPYDEVVRELEKVGIHRNVFLVNQHDEPIWRITDYPQAGSGDMFVDIRCGLEPATAIGRTFNGNIMEINLSDGTVKKVGWTK